MKTRNFLIVCALSAFTLQACEKGSNNRHSGNELVDKTYAAKYPGATQIEWERKGEYFVADFQDGYKELEAWFNTDGIWFMTETDLPFNSLPDAVKNAFQSSEYAAWHIDDIDMLERKDMETVYILEVEKGNQECDLHYSPEGILIKVVLDGHNTGNDHYPSSTLMDAIQTFISTHYPQARILETESEKNRIEVDILDGNTPRELLFTSDGKWINTKTSVRKNAVQQVVINTLELSDYSSYAIDDIYYIETPERNYYYFELESLLKEVKLIITLDGNIEIIQVSLD